jgi:hypothetical protein
MTPSGGRIYTTDDNYIDVYDYSAGVLTHNTFLAITPAGSNVRAVAASGAGVFAFTHSSTVHLYSDSSLTQISSFNPPGGGSPSFISMSNDGKVLAVELAGKVLVYTTTTAGSGYTLAYTYNVGGAIGAVEVASDGSFVAVASGSTLNVLDVPAYTVTSFAAGSTINYIDVSTDTT